MKTAVVGGGLFGCTAAFMAAREGHEVHLYEKGKTLFAGTTGASYYRLHRGYHYPRSPETGLEGQRAEAAFRAEYWPAVVDTGHQFYAIASDSLVDEEAFRRHCYELDLMWWAQELSRVNGCEALFRVSEPRIDVQLLKATAESRIRQAGVHVHTGTRMPMDVRERYDRVVIAAYENINPLLHALDLPTKEYKFQVVEKPIVRMPKDWLDTSLVVIDGPFCCIDPHGLTDLHVLGHVTETVHDTLVGKMPPALKEYPSKADRVIAACAQYVPAVADCKYIGSTFCIRCVLANMETTDARPTLVERHDEQVVSIFSGKLGTAVTAAQKAVEMMHAEKTRAA